MQRGYLTGLVGPEHLAQGACRHLTREAVDVDFLVFMLLAHRMAAFLQGPTEGERNHKSGMSPLFVPKHRKPPPSTCQLPVGQAAPDSLRFIFWEPKSKEANDIKPVPKPPNSGSGVGTGLSWYRGPRGGPQNSRVRPEDADLRGEARVPETEWICPRSPSSTGRGG